MADVKRVYTFGNKEAEGNGKMRELLGGKGANLAEMNLIGIPVPPGFTITTEVCTEYYAHGKEAVIEMLRPEVEKAVKNIERLTERQFGGKEKPLLVSVRSGARASMPGMMDTILNLGMNDEAVEAVAKLSGNPRFAWDSYRRFVQMYGDVVLGMKPVSKEDHDPFEVIIEEQKALRGVKNDTDLTTDDLKELVAKFKAAVKAQTGEDFPASPWDQLWGAICAVFGSWMNERAILYRKLNNIPAEWGTAVSVQAMVFGNMGQNSATGVAFSRDAATGENIFNGEYLINAQGEDVVAGIRTPQQITVEGSKRWAKAQNISEEDRASKYPSLEEVMPTVYAELNEIQHHLEQYFTDMQDIEFTIQDGKLWMLQCRNGKRTGAAMVKIAMDMLREGLIDEKTAVLRCEPAKLDELLHPVFDKEAIKHAQVITKGLPASPGAATGPVVFFAEEAEKVLAATGQKAVLVRIETSPEDLKGMLDAAGILTARGGMTSHAAVVARGMGKCCVSGAGELGGRRTRHWQVLRIGRRRAGDRLQGTHDQGERLHGEGGRLDLAQRFDRRGLPRRGGHEGRRPVGRFRAAHGAGRQVLGAEGPRQCRHAEGCRTGLRIRCRGHRSLPHGAHVLRGRPHQGDPRDDPRRRRGRPPRGAREAAAHPARRLRGSVQGHERLSGDRPPAGSPPARVRAPR